MPRTRNIVEVEDNVFIPRKQVSMKKNIHFRIKSRKHFTRYMSIFLILSNDVFVQALPKNWA